MQNIMNKNQIIEEERREEEGEKPTEEIGRESIVYPIHQNTNYYNA